MTYFEFWTLQDDGCPNTPEHTDFRNQWFYITPIVMPPIIHTDFIIKERELYIKRILA